MAAGKFSKDNQLSNIIPIESAFVSAYLSQMPPVFVKVYLFLVYICIHDELKISSLSSVAQQLNCTLTELTDALDYLSKHHLINYTSRPFSFEILSATVASKNQGAYTTDSLTTYADYFAGIRSLFPGRSISNSEYDKAKDWIEVYGFSVEAALLLISHCIETKDSSISFSYIDKVALSWANDNITTFEKAEEFLMLYQAKTHDVAKLLLHLGIKRTPTVDEIKLYQTWTQNMGFDLKAIKAACQETTKSMNPSLAYINRILENLHSLDLHSEKQIKAYLTENDSDRRVIAVILSELGERSKAITSTHIEYITKYREIGFKNEILFFVARLMCEKGYHTFTKFVLKLDELASLKKFTEEDIKKHFECSASFPASDNQKIQSGKFTGRNERYDDSIYTDLDDSEV